MGEYILECCHIWIVSLSAFDRKDDPSEVFPIPHIYQQLMECLCHQIRRIVECPASKGPQNKDIDTISGCDFEDVPNPPQEYIPELVIGNRSFPAQIIIGRGTGDHVHLVPIIQIFRPFIICLEHRDSGE